MWKPENIKWKFKDDCSDRSRNKWIAFATFTQYQRRKFLEREGLQYKDVPRCKLCHHPFFKCVCEDEGYHKKIRQRKKLLHLPFEEKLEYSRKIVEKTLKKLNEKKIYLAYSGGIDSECCVQLFKEAIMDGRVKVIFGATLVDFPETIKRVDELEKELKIKIIRAMPEKGISFRYIVEKYGLPLHSRSSSNKKLRIATSKCCELLKKRPMNKLTKDTDALIMGLRIEENQYRMMLLFDKGAFFYSKGHKNWRIYPVAYWSIDDIWKFQEKMGFNYNKIYDNTNCNKKGFYRLSDKKYYQIRTGCWSCPQSIKGGYLVWLERYYPNFYKALMVNFGLIKHHNMSLELSLKLKSD
jgi:3'-phosphoadenosine 5'-phosphosulfate sulfotransferase (PAPS reductase)/FAD synthetase